MPRTVQLSVAPGKADAVLARVKGMDGVVGLARHSGASIDPPGDLVIIQATNDATQPLMRVLEELRVLDGGSILTNEPRSIISESAKAGGIDGESNETIWDEMAFLLRQDTNLASNYIFLMMLSGAVAAVGLWTDTLHIVIGAMVIAPAFEPFVRAVLGLVVWKPELSVRGVISAAAGYASMALGGLLAVLVLRAADSGAAVDLETREWVVFWSNVKVTGVLSSVFAAAAGALVVTAQRSVLTTGVMIALALVPSMTLAGMALGMGDLPLMGKALTRWGVDALTVLAMSGIVLGLKQLLVHQDRAMG